MNRKKIFIIIAAALAVIAAAVIIIVKAGGGEKIKTDGVYPYVTVVKGGAVTVRMKSGDGWTAAANVPDGLTVTQKSDRDFRIETDGASSGPVSFILPCGENERYVITVGVLCDGEGNVSAVPGKGERTGGQQSFCDGTDIPVTVSAISGGSADVLFGEGKNDRWKCDPDAGLFAESPYCDEKGTHFTVSVAAEGEYKAVFTDLLNGLTCTVTFSADKDLNLTAVSAQNGTCEKEVHEKNNTEPKDEAPGEESAEEDD